MMKVISVWTILALLAIFNNACATAQPVTAPTPSSPLLDCGALCKSGKVDFFKNDEVECQCQDLTGMED